MVASSNRVAAIRVELTTKLVFLEKVHGSSNSSCSNKSISNVIIRSSRHHCISSIRVYGYSIISCINNIINNINIIRRSDSGINIDKSTNERDGKVVEIYNGSYNEKSSNNWVINLILVVIGWI